MEKYKRLVFLINNPEENEIAQNNLIENGYAWSFRDKKVKTFGEYPVYIFTLLDHKVLTFSLYRTIENEYGGIYEYIKDKQGFISTVKENQLIFSQLDEFNILISKNGKK